MRILLDAIFINNSGGKVLLDALVHKLFEANADIHFLLDERVKGSFPFLNEENTTYLPNSLKIRHRFYKELGKSFDKVLCFGNIPPSIRLKAQVFTYFHNTIFFHTSPAFSLKDRLLCSIKSRIIRALKNNTDQWWVQTSEVALLFEKYWKTPSSKMRILPFYEINNTESNIYTSRDPLTFLYVSDGHPNKLHQQLITAFTHFQSKFPGAKLVLTISAQYPLLIQQIENLRQSGISIINEGWCGNQKLQSLYQNASYLIYPSNQESFGLGLIEATHFGLKILAADLPYVHAVIQPSLTFDPLQPSSIEEAMVTALEKDLPAPVLIAKNQLDTIVKTLVS